MNDQDTDPVAARTSSLKALTRAYFAILDQCAPEDGLRHLMDLSAEMDARTLEFVRQARRGGITWKSIGAALGVTHQAVQMKYGKWVNR